MPHQPANSPLGAFLAALRDEKNPCILIGNMAAIRQRLNPVKNSESEIAAVLTKPGVGARLVPNGSARAD
jgi:hypothetical protein